MDVRKIRIIFAFILILVFSCAAAFAEEYNDAPLSGISIGIDPGHQARGNYKKEPIAPGSRVKKYKVAAGGRGIVTRIPEHATNLAVSLMLRDELKALGADVYMTRTKGNVNISNAARAQMMNKLGVDLVLHLHCDDAKNKSKHGIAIYVRGKGAKKKEIGAAAKYILKNMVNATGAKSNGIHYGNEYTGLNWSKVPAVLIEMGYLSNRKEDVLLNSPEYQKLLVDGMVEGIESYVEVLGLRKSAHNARSVFTHPAFLPQDGTPDRWIPTAHQIQTHVTRLR